MKTLKRRGVLPLLLLLGTVAIVLLVFGPTRTAANTVVAVDGASELALLQAGGFTTTSLSCMPCIPNPGDCVPVGRYKSCGQLGNTCCCKWCDGNWGCFGQPCFQQ